MLEGEPLTGYWFDRTQEYAARRRGETFDRLQYATLETVTLSPLPCWASLSPEAYRNRVSGMVAEIEEQAAAERKRTGKSPLGVQAILDQDPCTRPETCKKSPAPFVHAVSREIRKLLWEGYAWFVAEYRQAAERETASGRCRPALPKGLLPAGVAVRQRVGPTIL